LTLIRAQRAGHKPIALVGGATGMVGDPSGKAEERKLLSIEELRHNVGALGAQIARLATDVQMVDNYDWFNGYGYLEFLRDIGKHFSVNMMLGKESVRARLEDREHGISYTEFSYMLVQAYDFLSLYDRHKCTLQVGGSDQWGNITAGIDLVRRMRAKEVYGLTMPLVTNASGQKFGKSEKGNVWLDAARTPPYDFYQFFFRTEDRDVGRFLRYFTFLDEPTIVALEEKVRSEPEKREAQRTLAREVTRLVHGDAAVAAAETELPTTAMALPKPIVDVLVETGLCKSKGDARRQIEQGGVYFDGARIEDVNYALDRGGLVQRGKRDKHMIKAST
jgi:tyrosyl-tRNA synthetase